MQDPARFENTEHLKDMSYIEIKLQTAIFS
jgi:hypothetical protein